MAGFFILPVWQTCDSSDSMFQNLFCPLVVLHLRNPVPDPNSGEDPQLKDRKDPHSDLPPLRFWRQRGDASYGADARGGGAGPSRGLDDLGRTYPRGQMEDGSGLLWEQGPLQGKSTPRSSSLY